MNRLNPAMLLGTFATAATALLLIAVFSGSMLAVYALILVSFCMAPCWPTNFGLVIKGMGKDTQTAGSIVVMSIIGGAVIPLVMGIISDMNGGNMQIAFIAPLLCFVYVAFYGFWCVRKGYNMRELINTIAHIGYQVSDLTRSLAFYEPLGFQRQQRFSKPSPQGTIEVAFWKWRAPSSSCISFPLERPLTPLAAVSIIWRWKSATRMRCSSGWRRSVIRSMKGR